MKFIKVFLFLFIILNSISCQVKNPDNFTLTGAGYGGMYSDFNDLNNEKQAFQKVANKWGIKLESVGCVISNKIMWQMTKSNFEAERNIKRKFGSNWLENFKKEVHEEHRKITRKR